MTDVLHMLLGAALVCMGVLAAAFADRIRQLRNARRDHSERTPAREYARATRLKAAPAVDLTPGSDDVVAALVGAGYKKTVATQAALACNEREQATPESWIGAALRRCAQGGAS
jgi:Holliday junction resolvasome RuvABC DNA-binding subunit